MLDRRQQPRHAAPSPQTTGAAGSKVRLGGTPRPNAPTPRKLYLKVHGYVEVGF